VTLAGAYDLVVFDLDGVVYLGTGAVPGAPEAIRALLDAGTAVAYATNNASRRATEIAQLLAAIGVPARVDEVVTSARAAAQLLADDLPAGTPVLAVGAPALSEELAAVGLTPVTGAQERPTVVVQGYGPQVGWAQLAEACIAIRGGARWVATNTDTTMPSARGPVPGNGSLVAALSTALGGREPDLVVGKPEPGLLIAAAGHRDAKRPLVVGDRLDTDIEGAGRAGMRSLLVLTGVTTPADLLAAGPDRRPTYVAADCAALTAPEADCRVPEFRDAAAISGRWRVTLDDHHLVLCPLSGNQRAASGSDPAAGLGHGVGSDAVDALRALARAAWECPEWTAVRAQDRGAEAVLMTLGLDRVGRPTADGATYSVREC
jgi:HAD superfamily hydrolase (TIGR01450 family)